MIIFLSGMIDFVCYYFEYDDVVMICVIVFFLDVFSWCVCEVCDVVEVFG